ncbi:MAG: glycosyltransferase, partial [Gammaproteobacteria bacterium]
KTSTAKNHIGFTGVRTDLRDIISTASIVLSLSNKPESFGRTVQESLSLGVPVVGYDHGGVSDLLSRAFPAGKVAPGNLVQLEAVTSTLLDNPPTVQRYPFQSIQTMVDETLHVYREVAGR